MLFLCLQAAASTLQTDGVAQVLLTLAQGARNPGAQVIIERIKEVLDAAEQAAEREMKAAGAHVKTAYGLAKATKAQQEAENAVKLATAEEGDKLFDLRPLLFQFLQAAAPANAANGS